MKAYKILGLEEELFILVFDSDNVYVYDSPECSISKLPRRNRFSLKERIILLRIINGNGYPVKTSELVEAYGDYCGDKAMDDPVIYEKTEDKIREGIREIRRRVGNAYPSAKTNAESSFLRNYSGSGYSIDLAEEPAAEPGADRSAAASGILPGEAVARERSAEEEAAPPPGREGLGRFVRVSVSFMELAEDISDLYTVIEKDRHSFCWTELSEAVFINYVSRRSDAADHYEELGWNVYRPKAEELDPAKIMIELMKDDRDALIHLFCDRLDKDAVRRFVVHCRNISFLRQGRIRLVLFHRSAESFLIGRSENFTYHYYDWI